MTVSLYVRVVVKGKRRDNLTANSSSHSQCTSTGGVLQVDYW
jgi:hypothetical protein